MTQAAAPLTKIPTKNPQLRRVVAARPGGRAKSADRRRLVLAGGTGRAATRGSGEVIDLEYGITVYPAREEGGRWRAVWQEDGERQQCESRSEEGLAVKVERVTERLARRA